MKHFYKISCSLLVVIASMIAFVAPAQLVVDDNVTATQLANQIVGSGVTISNAQLRCGDGGAGLFSGGNTTNIGLTNGILLTSGFAEDASSPASGNTSRNQPASFNGDADLQVYTPFSIQDVCALTFDFEAESDFITVQYVFSSEEYNEYVCSQFNDIFGFFVSGPNPLGGAYSNENVALVPSSTLPVTVNSINNGTSGEFGTSGGCLSLSNAAYYVNNTTGTTIMYDGFTVVLTAQIAIVPGETYTFKFAIADASDSNLDSGVFIKANSFSIFLCQAGTISFDPNSGPTPYCLNDGFNDIISVVSNAVTPGENFEFLLTDADGNILEINETGTFNMSSYGEGQFFAYSISYSGVVSGIEVGQNIDSISANSLEGCFELSNSLLIQGTVCDDLPVLECPENLSVSCIDEVPSPNAALVSLITSECPGDINYAWVQDEAQGTDCNKSIIRSYSGTDNCGNIGYCFQNITVVDDVAPTIVTAPEEEIWVSCGTPVPALQVSFIDNCTESLNIYQMSAISLPGCDQTISRSITATDLCGNSINFTQIVHIVDDAAPFILTAPESYSIACNTIIPSSATPTFGDSCDQELTVVENPEVVTELSCGEQITRSWTATDNCGNSITAEQIITVTDDIAPQFGTINPYIHIQCGELENLQAPSATDNCNEVSVTFQDGLSSGGCYGVIVRTWIATDACGNSTSAVQYISILDNQGPVIENPADDVVDCDQAPTAIPSIEIYDACGYEVQIIEASQTIVDLNDCSYAIVWHWVAMDYCENISEATTTITVTDLTNPTIATLEPQTFNCDAPYIAPNTPSYDDNCDEDLELTFTQDTIPDTCQYNYQIVYTWTVTDNCGNNASSSVTYTVVDETNPIFDDSNEDSLTYACDIASVPVVEPIASDNCGDVSLDFEDGQFWNEGCTEGFTRAWTAIDECGNSNVFYQNIYLVDEVAPVIEGLLEITRPCDDYEGQYVTASDNCNSFEITHVDQIVSGGCEGRIIRTYTATDACGLSSTFVQVITLEDNQVPFVVNQTPSQTFECGTIVDMPTIEFGDNCDEELSIEFSMNETEGCESTITYTWIATDNCDNSFTASTVYTFTDTTDPIVEAPMGGQFSCDQEIEYGQATADDSCNEVVSLTFTTDTIAGGCPNEYVIIRTWNATDACGNVGTASASYYVFDNTAPSFDSVSETSFISCEDELPETTYLVSDNCEGEVEVVISEAMEDGNCPNEYSVIRTLTATDVCGNVETATHTIFVQDNTNPVIAAEEVIEVACDDEEALDQAFASATDNCEGDVELTYTDQFIAGECEGQIIRTYVAEDVCGNTSTFVQTINIIDSIAPTIAPYETEITVECGQPVPAFAPVFDDNCDNDLFIQGISSITAPGCEQTINRSFTATDNCGNSITASQVVHIIDTTAPTWNSEGFETSISCGTAINLIAPTASDVCNDVTINSSYEMVAGECDAEFTEIFSYVAVDACGNASDTLRYIVNTFDNQAPEFVEIPEDQILSCDGELPTIVALATDFCSDFEVTFVQDTIAGTCASNYQIVRTFTATDACGNVSEPVSVTYTIIDDVAPQFETELSDISIECFGEIVPVEVEVSDNCSTFEVNSEVNEIDTDVCGYGTFEVLYTATDACGNVNTASYIVTVADTQDPILSGVPANVVLACDAEIPAPAVVTAMDNCNGIVEVDYTQTYVGEMPAEGSISDCRLLTPALPDGNPCNYTYDWAMALFGMPTAHRYYQVAEGNLVRYPNGTAHVTASLVNAANSNNGFNVDVWFGSEMDWSEWSSQSFPTSFKADCGGEDANYQDWLYFILQAGEGAELTGFGAYDGSSINLVHAPSNNYFGFQLGDGANNYNGADNGFGGWFTYSGTFMVDNIAMGQGGIVTGAGDFAFELDCCPRYEIVRCWTAYDCAGNVTSACQTISFEGSTIIDAIQPDSNEDEVVLENDKNGISLAVFPNPANENATFTFSSVLKGRGKLEVFDMTGAKVAELFNNNIIDNTEYRVDLNVSVLARGIYTYRITNGVDTEVGRLIVTK